MRVVQFGVGLAIFLPSAPAAAEWIPIGTSVNEATWLMDADRVKVVSGKVQAWIKVDHSKDRTVTWRESKRLISFDCNADKFRMLSFVNYDSYGKVVASKNYSDYGYGIGYEPVIPDSMIETASKLACIFSSDREQ